MHKKLATDLTSLAHSILQMKNKDNVFALKEKAYQIFEKLAVLAYVEEYVKTPNASQTKEELINKIETETIASSYKDTVEEITEHPFNELQSFLFSDKNNDKNDVRDVGDRKTITLEEELEDTISLDVAADLFEKVALPKSLNDKLHINIQIDLNDRIAFVKHLFDGNQNDFNRVVSQLNTFKTEKEAKKFINKMVKPDYNWAEKEEYEDRFMEIVVRKFV